MALVLRLNRRFAYRCFAVFVSCFLVSVGVGHAAVSFRETQRLSKAFFIDPGISTTSSTNQVSVGDFDHDGRVDLVTAKTSDLFAVRFGAGDGTFPVEKSVVFPNGGSLIGAVATGDFIGHDGILDIVGNNGGIAPYHVRVGDGAGGFTVPGSDPAFRFTETTLDTRLAAADMNSDGNTDLVRSSGRLLEVSLSSSFGFGLVPGVASSGASPPAIADVNGDGRLDVVKTIPFGLSIEVFPGNGAGGFTTTPYLFPAALRFGSLSEVTLGDVDRDGDFDAVVSDAGADALVVLTNDGSGAFSRSVTLPAGEGAGPVVVSDVNEDGLLDATVGNQSEGSLSVFAGNGDGTFQARQDISTRGNPVNLKVVDVNNDGKPDLVVTLASSFREASLSVLINTTTTSRGSTAPEALTQPQPQSQPPVVSGCVVPRVTGVSLAVARKRLSAAGCAVGKVSVKKRSVVSVRKLKRREFSLVVVSQSVKPGVRVAKTAGVALQQDYRKVKKARKTKK